MIAAGSSLTNERFLFPKISWAYKSFWITESNAIFLVASPSFANKLFLVLHEGTVQLENVKWLSSIEVKFLPLSLLALPQASLCNFPREKIELIKSKFCGDRVSAVHAALSLVLRIIKCTEYVSGIELIPWKREVKYFCLIW